MTNFNPYRYQREAAERVMDIEQKRNNPNNEPTGPFTGRCHKCGSNDLWDDNLSYGCNCCGMISIN